MINKNPETLRNASGFFFCSIFIPPQTSRNGKTIPKKHPRSRKRLPPCFLYVARSSDGCPLPWSFLPLPELTAGKRQQRERNHNQRRTHQAKSELHAFQDPECTPLRPFWLSLVDLGCFRLFSGFLRRKKRDIKERRRKKTKKNIFFSFFMFSFFHFRPCG